MIDIARFRGNLVVSGGHAFMEDLWGKVRIGSQMFLCLGPCTRCQMICVDQSTGTRSQEPLKTLATFRRLKVRAPCLFCCCCCCFAYRTHIDTFPVPPFALLFFVVFGSCVVSPSYHVLVHLSSGQDCLWHTLGASPRGIRVAVHPINAA